MYEVIFDEKAIEFLEKLEYKIRERIFEKIILTKEKPFHYFEKLGANLSHVVISHVDKQTDLGFHRELLQSGAYVEYDSHFRWKTETSRK